MPEVLKALQKQRGEDGVEPHTFSAGPTNDEPELIEIEWCEAENEIIYDDAKGDELIPAQVRADQQLEMDWVIRQKVFVKML